MSAGGRSGFVCLAAVWGSAVGTRGDLCSPWPAGLDSVRVSVVPSPSPVQGVLLGKPCVCCAPLPRGGVGGIKSQSTDTKTEICKVCWASPSGPWELDSFTTPAYTSVTELLISTWGGKRCLIILICIYFASKCEYFS